ncbi:PREDICTED: probable beta-D-xylosidase 7 [Populus euphratica]|uniref:Probable beta-D-xylosidase 7 n=1 Tax=Populus euphratica TaxID=75702 RepID=A0AAJ6TIJ0_POPEU|nr:PREDICTED: probable beta-D-xylosidase 7 [Populus euphratica]
MELGAAGKEARALYNAGQVTGLGFWAPNVNIFRDPRWGRGQETPGEDPLVEGKYGASFVRGVQGDSFEGESTLGDHLQASACCKHYTAHDLDNWNGVNRFRFNAIVTLQDMADTYQPPFRSCVQEGNASGIMCSYNEINGIPSCAHHDLLTKTLRQEWGFYGYITSDCDAVNVLHVEQKYAKTPEDAVADALKSGIVTLLLPCHARICIWMDVECSTSARSKDFPVSYLRNYTKSAVEKRKVTVSEIDRALHNLFSTRMRLGLFNGDPSKQLYSDIGPDQVCYQEHQALALEAALDGIVLLKNADRLLPLSKSGISTNLLGNYFDPARKNLQRRKPVEMAQTEDQVILVMGLDQSQEKERLDRMDLVLPGKQPTLITAVAQAAKRPIVLVLLGGSPMDVTFAKKNRKIGSILWVGYPGQAGATALAQIIFGEHNPGGRLPMTWYPQDFTKVSMTDMRMRPQPSTGNPGRTYRFYEGEKVFEFGYGLSYSDYSYAFASVAQNQNVKDSSNQQSETPGCKLVSDIGEEQCENIKFKVTVRVKNEGQMAGKHPVLLFARHAKPGKGRSIKKLVGFQTVKLGAGEKTEIDYELSSCEHLSSANEDGVMVMEEGSQILLVGDKEHPITIIA